MNRILIITLLLLMPVGTLASELTPARSPAASDPRTGAYLQPNQTQQLQGSSGTYQAPAGQNLQTTANKDYVQPLTGQSPMQIPAQNNLTWLPYAVTLGAVLAAGIVFLMAMRPKIG